MSTSISSGTTRSSKRPQASHLPPGPKGRPIVGVFPEFRRDPATYLLGLAREYGDISRFRIGPQRMFFFNRPEHVQDILVTNQAKFIKSRLMQRAKILLGEGLLTSEGDFHLRQRRLAQPAFHRPRLMGYAATMAACAERAQRAWKDGETRDISRDMMRLTLSIVGQTLFSADVENEANEIGQAMTDVLGMFGVLMMPFSEYLQKLPLPAMRRFERARERLDQTIYSIIRERRASGADRGDLLSMLLLAQDDQGGGSMTDTQVRDEAMTLFLAGHETTANALTWTWYLLSQHPDVAAKLRMELKSVLSGKTPGFDDIPNLRYTEMVLAESMRLYPPAWAISRLTVEPHEIDGFQVAPGTVCILSPYTMQRRPDFFPGPERFDPERWTPEAKESRPKFSYFPFGAGPRICIGERFAWMEGILLVASIAQHWNMQVQPGHKVEHQAQITLRTRYGMRMILHKN